MPRTYAGMLVLRLSLSAIGYAALLFGIKLLLGS